CATGFKQGFGHDPLLSRLVADHGLATRDRWIVLAPDSTVPALTDDTRTLSLAGVAGQSAYPAADTLVGAKYAARGVLPRVRPCRTLSGAASTRAGRMHWRLPWRPGSSRWCCTGGGRWKLPG